MAQDLETRFDRFARQLPSAECIDEVVDAAAPGPRADYLWRERTVVVELKTLVGDPQGKIDLVISELSKRPDFPLFVGSAPVDKVLRHIHDGPTVMRQLREKVLRSVEKDFRSAKQQIANTRELFGCPDAIGVLVVLNQAVETLHPNDLISELSRLMERRQNDIHAVDAVWLLSEAHTVSGAHPCVFITGSRMERLDWADLYLDGLNREWARFNDAPLLVCEVEGKVELVVDVKTPLPRQPQSNDERWRSGYRANRYLEPLDDAAVFAHGETVFAELLPYFLKGGPRRPFSELEPLFAQWAHFLEEASQRGLDMRGFGGGVQLPRGL